MIWGTFLGQRLPTALCPERGDHGGSELYWYMQIWRSAKFAKGFIHCSVQFSHSVVSDSLQPHEPQHARQASLSITNSRSLPKPMSIESVMPSNHLILRCPLLLPSIFPSIRVFSNESAVCIRWPKYWSFSFSISPSKEYSELISFKIDWLDLSSGLSGVFSSTTVQKH